MDIIPEDIKYKDGKVCILHPNINKGVIVFHDTFNLKTIQEINKSGLKTGAQLFSENPNFRETRSIFHDTLFFRAPSVSPETSADYSSSRKTVKSYFGKQGLMDYKQKVYLRVDPIRTYVYSSEIRAKAPPPYFDNSTCKLLKNFNSNPNIMPINDERYNRLYKQYMDNELDKSRKKLSEYLRIIKYDQQFCSQVYNLYTSRKLNRSLFLTNKIEYPLDETPIERNSEILVQIPILTPDYFVNIDLF